MVGQIWLFIYDLSWDISFELLTLPYQRSVYNIESFLPISFLIPFMYARQNVYTTVLRAATDGQQWRSSKPKRQYEVVRGLNGQTASVSIDPFMCVSLATPQFAIVGASVHMCMVYNMNNGHSKWVVQIQQLYKIRVNSKNGFPSNDFCCCLGKSKTYWRVTVILYVWALVFI